MYFRQYVVHIQRKKPQNLLVEAKQTIKHGFNEICPGKRTAGKKRKKTAQRINFAASRSDRPPFPKQRDELSIELEVHLFRVPLVFVLVAMHKQDH